MATRELRLKDDEVLYKKCKEVENFDNRLHILLDDMYETMIKYNGVGLAAPQVGILKRVCVIDIGEGKLELVNPQIIETEGTQTDQEGCLSVPQVFGEVERPKHVKVKAQDRYGDWFEYECDDLMARAVCHECEHLDGHLFLEKVIRFIEN